MRVLIISAMIEIRDFPDSYHVSKPMEERLQLIKEKLEYDLQNTASDPEQAEVSVMVRELAQ